MTALVTFVAGGSGSLGTLIGALALLGLFVGPVMVTIFTVGGDLSPTSRSGAAMTMLASANVVGVALGRASAARWPRARAPQRRSPCRRSPPCSCS
ncbi:hypothetical protein NKG05_26170 [Oerskovia sp. M15]